MTTSTKNPVGRVETAIVFGGLLASLGAIALALLPASVGGDVAVATAVVATVGMLLPFLRRTANT